MTPQQEQQLSRDVGDLRVTAARIEGQLTGVTSALNESRLTDQGLDSRVRSLELWRWRITGIAVGAGGAAGWLVQLVMHR